MNQTQINTAIEEAVSTAEYALSAAKEIRIHKMRDYAVYIVSSESGFICTIEPMGGQFLGNRWAVYATTWVTDANGQGAEVGHAMHRDTTLRDCKKWVEDKAGKKFTRQGE